MSEQTLVDKIIGQVFAESGVKLTRDDPVLGLIIVQHKLLDEKLNGLEAKIQAFADSVNQSNTALANTLNELKMYREGILTDLAAETKRTGEQLANDALIEFNKQQLEQSKKAEAQLSQKYYNISNRLNVIVFSIVLLYIILGLIYFYVG
jgi:hypothetical protein